MRGVYTVSVDIASLSASKSLLHMAPPSDLAMEILAASITNRSNDANEQLEAGLYHVSDNTSTAGTSVTAADVAKHEQGDVDTTVVWLSNLTTEPDGLENLAIDKQGFSNLAGYHYDPAPEERPVISPSKFAVLKLDAAPATAFNVTAQITYREIGG